MEWPKGVTERSSRSKDRMALLRQPGTNQNKAGRPLATMKLLVNIRGHKQNPLPDESHNTQVSEDRDSQTDGDGEEDFNYSSSFQKNTGASTKPRKHWFVHPGSGSTAYLGWGGAFHSTALFHSMKHISQHLKCISLHSNRMFHVAQHINRQKRLFWENML